MKQRARRPQPALTLFISSITSAGYAVVALAHPTPVDDLMRPTVRVVSQTPLVIEVQVNPRVTVSDVRIETPNNLSGVSLQCQIGTVVANQKYSCQVSGSAAKTDTTFAVVVSGRVKEQDGHQHFSSRSLSVINPDFDAELFRAEQRQERLERRLGGKIDTVSPKKIP
jgi:hypothetical protein